LFRFADANRRSLRQRGLWYPTYDVVQRGRQLAHYDVAHAIVGRHVERFDFEGCRRYLEALGRHARADELVLLGLPGLLTCDDGADASDSGTYWHLCERTADATAALVAGFDAQLLFLVRRPDRLLERQYERAVLRNGYRRSISTFHRAQVPAFDLAGHINRWARRFRHIELRTIEQLARDEPPLHRLFASLGFPVDDLSAPNQWLDDQLPPRAVHFMRALNTHGWSDSHREEIARRLKLLRGRVHELCSSEETLLDPTTARTLLEEQRPALEELALRYGYDVPSTLFDLHVRDAPSTEACDAATAAALFDLAHAAVGATTEARRSKGVKPLSLRRVEQRVNSVWWRALRTASSATQSDLTRRAKEHLRSRAASAKGASPATASDDPVRRLRMAMDNHAFDDAAGLVDLAIKAAGASPPKVRVEVIQLASRALQATGDEEALSRHVATYSETLRGTAFDPILFGPSRSEVDPKRLLTRDGQVNAYVCDQLLQNGRIDVETIARLFDSHPGAHARNPELDLLLAGACAATFPESGTRALNRFLSARQLPLVTGSIASGTGIDRFQFVSGDDETRGPLVSVLLSAHDAEDTIVAAARSVLNQTHRDIELLVCDDASSDATPRRLLATFGDDPRVHLYRSPRNQGPYNVRNALLAEARGEFVTFHDADDLAVPNRIERQLSAMRRSHSAACVANWVRVRPTGTFVFFRDMKATRLSIVSMMVRRSAMAELGPFSPARFGADFEMYHRLRATLGEEQLARVRAPLIFGLWSSGSLTRTPGAEALESGFRSKARRRYAELALQRAREGDSSVSRTAVHELLEVTGNVRPARGVEPLT